MVEWDGLENRYGPCGHRGFEPHSLRQFVPIPSPARWSEYVLRPSMVFTPETCEFHAPFAEAIRREQSWLLEHAEEDGSWEITWQWGQYPEAFPVVREWWKGDHIVSYARFMRVSRA